MIFFRKTPIGTLGVEHYDNSLTHIYLPGESAPSQAAEPETPLAKEAFAQLDAYFKGQLHTFSLPLRLQGTPFQQIVWQALQTIPYGETRTYKDIAVLLGKPGAARAVGMANNRNPLPIVIPCHRVIGRDGKLVGYGGGLELKQHLLRLEAPFLAAI